MAKNNQRVNFDYYNGFHCRECKYFNGERTILGTVCTCPNREWLTPTSMFKRGKDRACSRFMRYRDDPLVVYIAGPMTGMPNFNRRAFRIAEQMLRNLGFRPVNPAMLPIDLPDEAYMPICKAMLEQCQAIYLLTGWEQSKGALQEMQWAMELGLKKLEAPDLVVPDKEEDTTDDEYEQFDYDEEGQTAF